MSKISSPNGANTSARLFSYFRVLCTTDGITVRWGYTVAQELVRDQTARHCQVEVKPPKFVHNMRAPDTT